jgi:murein DD-endopeptidase MepM/ murein hydrolase activator NlpD
VVESASEEVLATENVATDYGDRWLVHRIQAGDTISGIFEGLGLGASLLHQVVHCGTPAKQLANIKPGQTLRIRFDSDEQFAELLYQVGPTKKLRITREDEKLTAVILERDTEIRKNEASGVIESSLFGSAQKAGLSERLTMKLAQIFRWDIDFALEIRSGDRFSVVFSEEWLDDKKLRDGTILAAEFVNRGKAYRAVRFVDASGKAGYYTPEGKLMKKDFLRTPLKFNRISSKFTKRRWHPVLKRWRSHKGVDYAAPTGTPVKAAGDAKVTFVGRKGGYGKVIYLQHQGKYTTVYGHLSRFAKGLKKGQRVKQGQLIGYVGKTGLASGPHLHYEFRVNGEHRNPLKVTKLPPAPIDKKYRGAFKKATDPLLARLDTMSRTMFADAF